jgi:predicted aspartyl protease
MLCWRARSRSASPLARLLVPIVAISELWYVQEAPQPHWDRERQNPPDKFQPQPNPKGNGGGSRDPPGLDELVESMRRLQLLVEAQQRQLNLVCEAQGLAYDGRADAQVPGRRHANLLMHAGDRAFRNAFVNDVAALGPDSEDGMFALGQAGGSHGQVVQEDYQAEAYVKRGAGDEFMGRVPHKRQAFPVDSRVPTNQPHRSVPSPCEQLPEQHMGPSRTPHRRSSTDARVGQAPAGHGATRGPTGPTAPPPRGQGPNAAPQERAAPSQAPRTPFQGATTMGELAARNGRALAESACKEVVIDGREEAALSVQAIKLCAAGYLMGSEHYVEKGKHVASNVYDATEKYANAAFRRTSPGAGSPQAQVLGQMPLEAPELMQTCAHLGQPEEGAYGICRARVTVNGLPVTACIDSGASSSMIPLHTVKRANLLHRVSKESQHTFFTADGHEAKGHGVISGLGVHIGGDTLMKVDATVSKAGNYDLLLGNDFLGPLKATLDFSRGRLYFQKDETTTGFVELQFRRPTVAAMVMKWESKVEACTCRRGIGEAMRADAADPALPMPAQRVTLATTTTEDLTMPSTAASGDDGLGLAQPQHDDALPEDTEGWPPLPPSSHTQSDAPDDGFSFDGSEAGGELPVAQVPAPWGLGLQEFRFDDDLRGALDSRVDGLPWTGYDDKGATCAVGAGAPVPGKEGRTAPWHDYGRNTLHAQDQAIARHSPLDRRDRTRQISKTCRPGARTAPREGRD